MIQAREVTPNELRIGNLVNYKYWNPHPTSPSWEYSVVKIVGTLKDDFYFTELNKKSVCKIKELHSIPLTEEWLLKFGYKQWDFRDNHYAIKGHSIWHCEEMFLCDKNGVVIKHVHQLQNLYFALAGEELTLNTKKAGTGN